MIRRVELEIMTIFDELIVCVQIKVGVKLDASFSKIPNQRRRVDVESFEIQELQIDVQVGFVGLLAV